MRKLLILMMILPFVFISARGAHLEAPQVPANAQEYMPYEDETFAQGLLYIIATAIRNLQPDLATALRSGLLILSASIATSVVGGMQSSVKQTAAFVSVLISATALLNSAHSMISIGVETIEEMNNYGKLLLPVMTTALASQGGVTASAALYAGTTVFATVLSAAIKKVFVPLLYIFIALSVGNRALGEDVLGSFKQFLKWLMTWVLKLVLYIFTGYITVTGVVSGSADAMTLKATKITVSGMIPVVGGIISDASEAILVGAGIMKSTAGIYGIFAFLAICINPILKISLHCIVLKVTAALSSMFGPKAQSGLAEDFSQAMSLTLAATGSICLLLLISTVSFMKGAS